MKKFKNLLKREKGVTTVEWLIIIAAVAVLATLAVNTLRPKIEDLIDNAADSISTESEDSENDAE